MAIQPVTVRVNTAGLHLLRRAMGGNAMKHPEIRAMLKRMGVRYLAAMSRRYVQYSRGGGDWPPLSERTIEQRRLGSDAILVDRGLLVQALEPGNPGNHAEFDDRGFVVGFSKQAWHVGSTITYAKLAEIHSLGLGNVPSRPILVAPPESVLAAARLDAEAAIERVLDDAAQATGVNRGKRPKYPSAMGFSRVGGSRKSESTRVEMGFSQHGITTFNKAGRRSRSFFAVSKRTRQILDSSFKTAGRVGFGAAKLGAKGVVGAARISAATRGVAPAVALIAGFGVLSLVNAGNGRRRGGPGS